MEGKDRKRQIHYYSGNIVTHKYALINNTFYCSKKMPEINFKLKSGNSFYFNKSKQLIINYLFKHKDYPNVLTFIKLNLIYVDHDHHGDRFYGHCYLHRQDRLRGGPCGKDAIYQFAYRFR